MKKELSRSTLQELEIRTKEAIEHPEVTSSNWAGLKAAGFNPLGAFELVPSIEDFAAVAVRDIVITFDGLESAFTKYNLLFGDYFDHDLGQPVHRDNLMNFYVRPTKND